MKICIIVSKNILTVLNIDYDKKKCFLSTKSSY